MLYGHFTDAATFDSSEKTAVSVRDGVLEYQGFELGLTPADKTFMVYRSPATIANAAMRMPGISITDGHVSMDTSPPSDGGEVTSAEMVDASDESTLTTIAILNKLAVSDSLLKTVAAGKRELSLGYSADMVPHDDYDFEQRDIRPHHLAVVDQGRNGPMCSFLDQKPEESMTLKLHKAFCDAEGAMNLLQIVELANALPEAIKSVPVDQLAKLLPALQAIVEAAKGVMPEEELQPEPEPDPDPMPVEGEDKEPEPEQEPEEKEDFADQVSDALAVHTGVIEKARGFLDDAYGMSGKTTNQIMQDALNTQTSEKFTDAELPLAFKLLKQPEARYANFGDSVASGFDKLSDQEI